MSGVGRTPEMRIASLKAELSHLPWADYTDEQLVAFSEAAEKVAFALSITYEHALRAMAGLLSDEIHGW